MVLSQIIRSRVQPIVDPIGRSLGKAQLTPDVFTGLGFALALLGGLLFALKPSLPYMAGFSILGSGIMDILDGSLASDWQSCWISQ